MTEERWPLLQQFVDRAHDYWQLHDGMSYERLLKEIAPELRVAMIAGKLNYQVGNGGFDQWWANGYGKDRMLGQAVQVLSIVEGEACKKVLGLVGRFGRVVEEYEESYEDEDDYSTASNDLDTEFYKVNEAFMDEVEAWLRTRETARLAGMEISL